MAIMPLAESESTPEPTPRDVAHYLREMAGQLAAMALGAGLHGPARALAEARELCDAALDGEA